MPIEPNRLFRYITAKDVAERLTPDLTMNEALLWPPDLFAYTSYIMTVTSAYQLVVSPPSGRTWPPGPGELRAMMCDGAKENLERWLGEAKAEWGADDERDFEDCEERCRRAIGKLVSDVEKVRGSQAEGAGGEQSVEQPEGKSGSVWNELVKEVGGDWQARMNGMREEDFDIIDDVVSHKEKLEWMNEKDDERKKILEEAIAKKKRDREKRLLKLVLDNTPPLLLSCWAFFYKEVTRPDFHYKSQLRISDLLCTQDDIQGEDDYCGRLWLVTQALLTMHAIADIASLRFGINANPTEPAHKFAEKLLFGRPKEHPKMSTGGSLSTYHTERCRVLPKRHNPSIGITLRSISSNLAFHQSAVDVVWRKTMGNPLTDRLIGPAPKDKDDRDRKKRRLSLLLLPFPLEIKTKDFGIDKKVMGNDGQAARAIVNMSDKYGFFSYEPDREETRTPGDVPRGEEIRRVVELLKAANDELPPDEDVDMLVFPETSLTIPQFNYLETELMHNFKPSRMNRYKESYPSIIIAGVRESREELAKELNERKRAELGREPTDEEKLGAEEFNFPRNAVYCKYFDREGQSDDGKTVGSYYNTVPKNPEAPKNPDRMPKYKQYKHHRWQLDASQIRRYGLSRVLDTGKIWWESIKIPKRRVSFLNVGDRMTISHLICEDLARQDPIAELVRHVGPTLVVTILMDGPQLKNRWSARYATVLSDDPGCSVITLTSLGMVKRHSTEFGLMSRVVGLWNESGGQSREIELAQGAEAVLLTFWIDTQEEKTADGRQETVATAVLRLVDVIQIYPTPED